MSLKTWCYHALIISDAVQSLGSLETLQFIGSFEYVKQTWNLRFAVIRAINIHSSLRFSASIGGFRLTSSKPDYNIPRACLLNRSPVPAMDLKSNRSGLWRHMVAELVGGWEDYVANIQIMSPDMVKLYFSQLFCRATKLFCRGTWVSCLVGVTLCCDFYTFRSCNIQVCTFRLTTFAVLRHTT